MIRKTSYKPTLSLFCCFSNSWPPLTLSMSWTVLHLAFHTSVKYLKLDFEINSMSRHFWPQFVMTQYKQNFRRQNRAEPAMVGEMAVKHLGQPLNLLFAWTSPIHKDVVKMWKIKRMWNFIKLLDKSLKFLEIFQQAWLHV